MKNRYFAIAAFAIIACVTAPSRAADASYKHWRNSMKEAEQARYRREFERMREILEGSAPEAQKLGSLSSAENAYWLSIAYRQLGFPDKALDTFNTELARIGPNPTATKLQVIRGVLLSERAKVYYRMNDLDKALDSAVLGKSVLEDAAGKFHPELYEVHMTIGRIHAFRKDFGEAEKSMRTAFKLAQSRETRTASEWSGAESQTVTYVYEPAPQRVIRAGTDLGNLLLLEQKYDDAEPVFKTALESARAAYAKDSYMQLLPLRGLAEVDLKKGKRKEFNKDVQQVYQIVSKTPGLEASSFNPIWLKLNADLDDANAAETVETTGKLTKIVEFQNLDFSDFVRRALSLAVVNGQPDWKREELLQAALSKVAESYAASNATKSGLIYGELGNFAADFNKPDLADAMYGKAIASQQSAKDKGLLISVLGKMSERKLAGGKKSEALALSHEVTLAMREKYGNDMRTADAMDREAAMLKENGQDQAAADLLTAAMEVRKKSISK